MFEAKNGEAGLRTAAGRMPRLSELLPQHEQAWLDAMENYIRESWQNNIKFMDDGLLVSAKVKKYLIEDFIQHVYGHDSSYFEPAKMLTWKGRAYLANSLPDLRAFIAQELNSRRWYQIRAEES